MDLAVLNGDHGLDGKHLAHRAHRAGNSAAATQVLKGIEQADDNHAVARGLDGVGDLLSAKTPVHQLQRVLHQDVLANRNALRVHNAHGRIDLRGGGSGALMRAGELGREGYDHDVLSRSDGLLVRLRIGIRVHLAGAGQLVAFDKQLVEALMAQIDTVLVHGGVKGNGQR